jgi:transposase InsO family protein
MLNIMDEYSRECLKIHIDRRVKATDVLYELSDLFVERGVPDFLRSENGSEFTAKQVREWLQRLGVKTLFIEPGSPWENGYIESFNGKMRDELLNGEIFDTILEAKVVTERRRKTYLPAAGRQHNTATQFTGISAPPPRRPDIPSACQWLNI